MNRHLIALIVLWMMVNTGPGASTASEPAHLRAPSATGTHVPVLAYYYIWFDTGSWDRAKIDYPSVGRYSSDDPTVIHGQIRSAKAAGIDGFISVGRAHRRTTAASDS
jgi:hypothetical protein